MKDKAINELIKLFYISVGCIIFVAGINLFLTPAGVYATGLMGFSRELSQLIFNSDNFVTLVFWCLNLPLIIFGFFKVGKKFLFRTIVAVIVISIAESVIKTTNPLIPDNKLLAVVLGSILMGVGTGLALSRGGSTGGTDILATYISIIKGKSFGVVNIFVNTVVIVLAVVISKNIEVGVYMLISIYVGGIMIDKVNNYNQKMTFFIVTDKKDEVVKHVTANFMRGITIFDSMGGYSKNPNNTLMITVSKDELHTMAACVKEADPDCFVNVFKVQKLIGSFKDNYVEML